MENKQFPERESHVLHPEALVDIPLEMEPLETEPAVEPLAFEEAITEDEPVTAEETHVEEQAPVLESLPVEVPAQSKAVTENAIAEDTIPEVPVLPAEISVKEAAEPAPAQELPAAVSDSQEISADPPKQEDPAPVDLNILEDPAFRPLVEEAPMEEVPKKEAAEEKAQDLAFRNNDKDFDTLFQAPPPEPAKSEEVPSRPMQKGRPKRKKGEGLFGIPNILATVVWLALIVAIGVTAGRMLWVCAADVLAFGREDKVVTVTIYEADTMDDIVEKLHKNGLIRYKSLFNLYASISDAEEDIKPGIYDLNTRYDYHALVNFMSPRSSREVVRITIPEGYTCKQVFQLLEENRVCTALDAAAYAASGELKEYWFLENVERGSENCLEGFLFPDTYDFYKNSTPREALQKMLDGFEYRFTDEMRAQIEALNANVTGGGYTVREIAIVASLIEKESAAPAESPKIAGVIYNRLFRWEFPALLNIDAAIVYAQGGESDTIDTSLDSPYNTYLNVGLTPTPIANPGLSSLQAALQPESHNFYYYVLNPETGMHKFSTTQAEHDASIAAFYE